MWAIGAHRIGVVGSVAQHRVHQRGSTKVRAPASVLVDLTTRPCPRTRTAAARTSIVPASRSTAFQDRPQASPMRSPVAIRKPTRSGRQRAMAC
ncbi:hypothetical protein SAMN05660657_03935 [Geodermatophilus amargosae]|uniref:Uncharacterized protein n=1 Tax=Geodermatophilus amargosae TaxID=1296565 RepID=A0A1I7C0N1_9ACTN|nr:hypothetical protein SAMN05660657_03935 [Geodermatophilus amargosae]